MNRKKFVIIGLPVILVLMIASQSLRKHMLLTDPVTLTAIETAKTESKSLLAALEDYHHQNGVYPASVKELPRDPLWGKYLYKAQKLTAVYKSPDCQKRINDLMGFQTPEKIAKMAIAKAECLAGYSQFTIKSQIQPENYWNKNMFSYIVFESQNADWSVDWCHSTQRKHLHCDRDLFELQRENRQ